MFPETRFKGNCFEWPSLDGGQRCDTRWWADSGGKGPSNQLAMNSNWKARNRGPDHRWCLITIIILVTTSVLIHVPDKLATHKEQGPAGWSSLRLPRQTGSRRYCRDACVPSAHLIQEDTSRSTYTRQFSIRLMCT